MSYNIVLIGMPGAGKSTVGVILAKSLGMEFCDTDLLIQKNENMVLQDIIDKYGMEYFKQCEEKSIMAAEYNNCVIATGGSAVYSEAAMKYLKKNGIVVYLSVSPCVLKKRIDNFATRGIIGSGSMEDIFAKRRALYEKYADITVNCDEGNTESNVKAVIDGIEEMRR